MSSTKKFHLNGSTVLSLNERFTRMQGHGGNQPSNRRVEPSTPNRSRTRSRSRARVIPQQHVTPKISFRNRNLLAQLDQKHVLRAALKLKRRSLKMKSRMNRASIGNRRQTIINASNPRKRNIRPNNVAKQIATIKADLLKNIKRVRQLSRSSSKLNLNEQISVRGRPRLKRNNNVNARISLRARSRSRNRTGQNGANPMQNVRERSSSRQRSAGQMRQKLNVQQSQTRIRGRSSDRQNSRKRINGGKTVSVNARLQLKRRSNNNNSNNNSNNNNAMKKVNGPIRGRITKNVRRNQQKLNKNQYRKPTQRNKKNRTIGQRQFRGKQVRGRQQKTQVKREPTKSKEQLDAELEQYMVNTTSGHDQEMGI